jgi:hypothetical protein
MGVKAEISWRRKDAEGQRRDVYAQHVGSEWRFFCRERRFDAWQRVELPPIEDWMALLDAVERRIARRLLRPEEADRVRRKIREAYPDAGV